MSNQETQKSQAQLFSITIDSSMPENSTKVKLDLKKKMECSIGFMANSLRAVMKQDEDIRTAIVIALVKIMSEQDGDSSIGDLLSELSKSN